MMVRKTTKYALASVLAALSVSSVSAREIEMNMAKMQAMDKITGRVSEIEVPVGGETQFGSFSIVVRACKTRPPEETPENYAFVDVVDNYDTQKPVNIFKGWMLSSSPALNAVSHPIYDVWLLDCFNGKVEADKLLSAEDLQIRDEIEHIQENKKDLNLKGNQNLDEVVKEENLSNSEEKSEETTEKETEEVAEVKEKQEKTVQIDEILPEEDADAPKSLINIQEQNLEEKEIEPQDKQSEEIQNDEVKSEESPLDVNSDVVQSQEEVVSLVLVDEKSEDKPLEPQKSEDKSEKKSEKISQKKSENLSSDNLKTESQAENSAKKEDEASLSDNVVSSSQEERPLQFFDFSGKEQKIDEEKLQAEFLQGND